MFIISGSFFLLLSFIKDSVFLLDISSSFTESFWSIDISVFLLTIGDFVPEYSDVDFDLGIFPAINIKNRIANP